MAQLWKPKGCDGLRETCKKIIKATELYDMSKQKSMNATIGLENATPENVFKCYEDVMELMVSMLKPE